MAINYSSGSSNSITGANQSVNLQGADFMLYFFLGGTGGTATATYGGKSMTMIETFALAGTDFYSFYLKNPPQGGNQLVTSVTPSGFTWGGTGISQSAPDAFGHNTALAGGNSIANTITTVADNCWVVAFVVMTGATSTFNGTNWISRGLTGSNAIGDNNQPITPPGNLTQTVSCSPHTISSFAAIVQVSLSPSQPLVGDGSFLINFI